MVEVLKARVLLLHTFLVHGGDDVQLKKILAFLVGCLSFSTASAMPIQFQLTFLVDQFFAIGGGQPLESLMNGPTPETKYYAYVTVDDAILLTDGYNAGKVLDFHGQIGAMNWNSAGPFSQTNDFEGLRGPCYYQPPITCMDEQLDVWGLGSDSLGFVVENGTVTKLHGGIYGGGDTTFIDFYGDHYNSSTILKVKKEFYEDGWDPDVDMYSLVAINGSAPGGLIITRVPEPATTSLVGLGLLGFVWGLRRRSKRISS